MAQGDVDRQPFVRQIDVLARPQDIVMGFSPDGHCVNVAVASSLAQRNGLLTLALTNGDGDLLSQAKLAFCFIVPAQDPLVIQGTQPHPEDDEGSVARVLCECKSSFHQRDASNLTDTKPL